MKIMCFNIQHGAIFDDPERKINLRRFAEYIKEESPDVVGLCEVRGLSDGAAEPEEINAGFASQAKILASLTGMNYVFAPAIKLDGNGLYGNALLTRYTIAAHEVLPIPSPDQPSRIYARHYEDRCLLRAVLDTGEERITVLVCHMGLNPDERLAAVVRVCGALDAAEGRRILLGDFNMPPDCELLTPIAERLTDTAIKLAGQGMTFPSDAPEIKIDYIFASHDFEICSAKVAETYISDHRAYLAELK